MTRRARLLEHNVPRFQRMLTDLQLEPGSILLDADGAIIDGLTRRRLSPPIPNQTLAEGIISAIKIASELLGSEE